MNGCEKVFTHHFFIDNDGILKVVTLPRHECNLQIAPQGQLTILHSISFSQEVAILHTLSFGHSRTQGDRSFLVGLDEFGQSVHQQVISKTYKLLGFVTLIANMDFICIYKFNNTISFCMQLNPCIAGSLAFQTSTYDRCLRLDQWNGLTLHV